MMWGKYFLGDVKWKWIKVLNSVWKKPHREVSGGDTINTKEIVPGC